MAGDRRRRPPLRRLGLLALLVPAVACSQEAPARPSTEAPATAEAPAAAPRTVGVDSALLGAAYARAAEMPRLRSLLVSRHGRLMREAYFRGARADRPANIKSVSKSVLSALVGIAIAEGKIAGVEQPVSRWFATHLQNETDARKRRITVGHLLSMQSGLRPTSFGNYGAWVNSPNWVRYVLRQPMVDDPGGRMLYSTGSTHLLSAILTQATGQGTWQYARDRLARPLGVELPRWATDPQGVYFGGNDMYMKPRDMLRFGELYRNGGVWEGRQVVPAEWVRTSWTPRTVSPFNGHRYGYGWWIRDARGHAVYFAWGYGGQFIFVVPSLELTVVTTSDAGTGRDGGHLRAVHDLLTHWIVPAAERGGNPPGQR